MKIILREDVTGLGEAGAVVEAADGYARNFLLPRKLAMEATPGAVKQLETYRQALARKHRKLTGDAEKVAASLAGITITLTAKAGEGGRLYGSITSADIAEALLERHQIEVDKRKIELADHIKTVGTYEARVRLHKGVDAALTVEVVAIDQPAEAAPAVEPAPEPAAAPLAEA